MALPPFLSSIVGWLRAGYPDGVPEQDYLPLFALLARRLTEAEARQIAEDFAASSDPDAAARVRAAIADITRAAPTEADLARVSGHLAAGGWPLGVPGPADGHPGVR